MDQPLDCRPPTRRTQLCKRKDGGGVSSQKSGATSLSRGRARQGPRPLSAPPRPRRCTIGGVCTTPAATDAIVVGPPTGFASAVGRRLRTPAGGARSATHDPPHLATARAGPAAARVAPALAPEPPTYVAAGAWRRDNPNGTDRGGGHVRLSAAHRYRASFPWAPVTAGYAVRLGGPLPLHFWRHGDAAGVPPPSPPSHPTRPPCTEGRTRRRLRSGGCPSPRLL